MILILHSLQGMSFFVLETIFDKVLANNNNYSETGNRLMAKSSCLRSELIIKRFRNHSVLLQWAIVFYFIGSMSNLII